MLFVIHYSETFICKKKFDRTALMSPITVYMSQKLLNPSDCKRNLYFCLFLTSIFKLIKDKQMESNKVIPLVVLVWLRCPHKFSVLYISRPRGHRLKTCVLYKVKQLRGSVCHQISLMALHRWSILYKSPLGTIHLNSTGTWETHIRYKH